MNACKGCLCLMKCRSEAWLGTAFVTNLVMGAHSIGCRRGGYAMISRLWAKVTRRDALRASDARWLSLVRVGQAWKHGERRGIGAYGLH